MKEAKVLVAAARDRPAAVVEVVVVVEIVLAHYNGMAVGMVCCRCRCRCTPSDLTGMWDSSRIRLGRSEAED